MLSELARRSEVFRRLTRPACAHTPARSTCSRTADACLVGTALAGVGLVLLAAVPFAATCLLLLPLGALFPIAQLAIALADGADQATGASWTQGHTLPLLLSAIHLALLVALLALLPVVHRFQALRADLLPTSDLPAAFFALPVVDEIRRRFELSTSCSSPQWDYECCVCIRSIEPHEACMLHGCHHFFHERCISEWLREHSTCPLCRAPASLGEMTAYADCALLPR